MSVPRTHPPSDPGAPGPGACGEGHSDRPGTPAGGGEEGLDRQPYLRRALDALEGGQLDVAEYAQRVRAINAAGSAALMEAVAADTPGGHRAPPAAPGGEPDPVDLALMGRRSTGPSSTNGPRYLTLVVVLVLFAVLLGIGVYLASHVHGVTAGAQHLGAGVAARPGGVTVGAGG